MSSGTLARQSSEVKACLHSPSCARLARDPLTTTYLLLRAQLAVSMFTALLLGDGFVALVAESEPLLLCRRRA